MIRLYTNEMQKITKGQGHRLFSIINKFPRKLLRDFIKTLNKLILVFKRKSN